MKRDASSLFATTLRIGFLVGLAALLILVLLPAAVAAQAAGLRCSTSAALAWGLGATRAATVATTDVDPPRIW